MLRELFRIISRQWTFYLSIAVMLVCVIVQNYDISAKIAQWYIGGIQVFIVVFYSLLAVRYKRKYSYSQKLKETGNIYIYLEKMAYSFVGLIFGVFLSGALFMLLHLR